MEGLERDRGPGQELIDFLFSVTEKPEDFWDWVEETQQSDRDVERLLWWMEFGQRYHERPVDFETFLFSPAYMRLMDESGDRSVWPLLVEEGEAICSGSYVECVLTGGIGWGKALALDTPIPTPSGWATMGDLEAGDQVFDERGRPCRVVGAFQVMRDRPCYRVEFSDGTAIVADEDHLWETHDRSQRANRSPGRVRTTKEIRDSLGKAHCVVVAGALECPDQPQLGVDPYTLGVWLGDGSSGGAKLWCQDREVADHVRRWYHVTERHPPSQAIPSYTVHGLQKRLRHYGLLGNKHIPRALLRASRDQRLALLQGLMDTDGTVDKVTGRCEFSNTNERLVRDVLELVRSLGWKPGLQCKRAKIRGRDCGPTWDVAWTPWTPKGRGQQVFRLARKAQYQGIKGGRRESATRWRRIVSVTPVESVPVRCIQVDSPSKLYLAGEGMVPTHNTSLALLIQAYELYKLLCLKDPHRVFELMPGHEILVVFQSLDKDKAEDIDYQRFKQMLDRAPIFSEGAFAYDREIKSEMRFPKNIVVKPISGAETGALGMNVIGGIIDELDSMALVEKSLRARDRGTYDQAKALYSSIARRRESRFMQHGEMPGMLCLVSSKQYQGAFTDQKEAQARDTPDKIRAVNLRVWDVKPWQFTEDRSLWFRVFVGDATRKPRILGDGERVRDKDLDLVHEVPPEYLEQFKRDLVGAIRDILGVSTHAGNPFILDRDAVARCFGAVRSVGSRDVVDFVDRLLKVYPGRWRGSGAFPRSAHIDLALSQDHAGLAIGHVPRFEWMKRTKAVVEAWPVIRYDLLLSIAPPPGGEIQFEKIRRLLYLLRERGLPITWVTCDSWQSTDMLQILASKGFLVGEESTDKTPAPYELLKTAIYDGRVEAPECETAQIELVRLERDPKKGKIDHPPDGSKDVSDAMACVAFNLSLMPSIWAEHGVDLQSVPMTLKELAERHEDPKGATQGEDDVDLE